MNGAPIGLQGRPAALRDAKGEIDLARIHQLCRLRSTLEAFAVAQLRKREGRSKIRKHLDGRLRELRARASRGNYPGFFAADSELHREMVRSAGLPPLLNSWEIVVRDLDRWIHHVQQSYWPSLMSLYQEHVLLLEAWESEDDWIAEEATHQHLEAGWYRLAAAEKDPRADIDPVERAASFISTHFASKLEIPWIARQVSFVSASHLTRLFRQKKGISPLVFVKRVRLERAAELILSSPDEISVIAKRVGYKNCSHFVRDFRKHFGLPPLAYRRTHKSEKEQPGPS